MNKTVNMFFVGLGVLFVVVLLIGAGFYLSQSVGGGTARFSDQPTNTAPSDMSASAESAVGGESGGESDGASFTLTAGQRQALDAFGIDPASVPDTITAEQEACFVSALGSQRVEEIKGGAVPSAVDFFKAKNCI